MGKRKSKKRKNKLARPPKRNAGLKHAGIQWERAVRPPELDADFGGSAETISGSGQFDAPCVPYYTPESERPFGAVDPSMYESTRYRKFRDQAIAIRESLPDSKKAFAAYDVADLEQRKWLTRYCISKEAGKLPGWQQFILEKVGFNWVRGHPPTEQTGQKAKRKARSDAARTSRYELAWTQAYRALEEVCAAAPDSRMAMVALLRTEDTPYEWLRKQIVAIRAGKLKADRMAKLQALPFDFDAVLADRGFTRWRASFKAYAAGKLDNADRWADAQRRAKAAGKLLPWRIEALDAIDFDWTVRAASSVAGNRMSEEDKIKKTEARWRAKLETYLALEAEHGKPLSAQIVEVHSLRPWLSRMRQQYKKGQLRDELIAEFEARGFEFSGIDVRRQMQDRTWNRQFEKLLKFKERFGHARVPASYQDDPELGVWLARQRERLTLGKLKGEKLDRLRAVGIRRSRQGGRRSRVKVHISAWLKAFRRIETFLQAEHGGQVPTVGRISDKHRNWLKRQQNKMKAGELEPWQLEKLDAIGFDPDRLPEPPPQVDWDDRLERLRRFVQENGHAGVTRSCADKKLYAFVQWVRQRKRNAELSAEQLQDLRELDFSFDPRAEVSQAWMRHYETLKAYFHNHGDSNVPRAYPEAQGLSEFVAQARQRGRKGLLLAEHIRLLDELDFQWSGGRPTARDG